MLHPLSSRTRPGIFLLHWKPVGAGAVLLGLFLPVLVRAQELPADGIEKLEKAYSKDQRNLIGRLGKAEINPPRPEDEPTIDLCAKWHIYRFTWKEDPKAKPKLQEDPGRMQQLYSDFEGELNSFAKSRPDNRAFLAQFGKKLIAHAREVLVADPTTNKPNDKVIARVNVARVLARLAAEPEQEEAADVFVEVLKDKDQNPAVQYWALRGLRDLFALGQPRLDDKGVRVEPTPMKNRVTEENAIRTLIEFIERKLPTTLPPDELRGLRAVRREAIRALGMSRYPALLDAKKAIQGSTALVLLRVLRKDGLTPPPGPDEQLEAALGLARLQSKLYDGYQPDYTAHELGMFVSEFATRYVNEGGERGWKVAASRLTDALAGTTGLKADVDKNVKDAGTKKYVGDVVAKSVEILRAIENKTGGLNAANFGDWIGKTLPKSETVYRDVPEAKVNPPTDP